MTHTSALHSTKHLQVNRVDIHAARQFFQAFEHLGDCGLGVWHYAASDHSGLVGVISIGTTCFARGRGHLSTVAVKFGTPIYQIARGGTSTGTPFNTPSRVLSQCLKKFHDDHGECLLVAYADRAFNEMGTIYQACNAVYTGKTDPKGQSNYLINGRRMSGWSVRKRYGTRSLEKLQLIDTNAIRIPLTSKYRYLFVLATPSKKRRLLNALGTLSRPYPKRSTECIPPMNVKELILERARLNEMDCAEMNELTSRSSTKA